MATIENKYTGDGSTTKFSITFEYLRETDVKATINKVATTAFTFANATTLEFNVAPPNNQEVRIFRDTATDELITEFFPGSAIRAQDLNDNANQVLFVGQEVKGRSMVTTGDTMTGDLVMDNANIVFEGSTDDANETTLTVVDPTADRTVTLPDQSGTVPLLAAASNTQITATPEELNTLDGITTTVAELNILDGVTATTSEINTLDGITASTAELNLLDGVTSTTAELNILDGVTATASEINTLDGITATTAELNTMDGITATTAELNKMDGVTASTAELNLLDGVTATTAELNLVDGLTATTTELNLLDGVTASTAELNLLDGVTATTAELNVTDGITATTAELNQLDGNTLRNTGTTWTTNTDFPSATEVEGRINSKIAPLGGFEAITDDESFPETQPADGVIISIADAGGLVVDASGQSLTADTITTDTQVTINGFPPALRSDTVQAGIGLMVVSTGANQIYNYHRVIATDGDVIQLSDDINDFNNRYRPAAASDYTTDNDVGDTYFNTTTNTLRICSDATGNGTYVDAVVTDAVRTDGGTTGAGKIPVGTEAQRPSDGGTPATLKGYFRFNDDSDKFEGHNGTAWGSIGGGATGTGGDTVFVENLRTVTQSYTVGNSVISQAGDACGAVTVGPLIINSNATVTVPTNCNLVIL